MTKLCIFIAVATFAFAGQAAERPDSRALAGKWEGAVTFGKFKFTLIMRVATNDAGGLKVTLDLPEQGQTGMPVDAFLFNPPEVRLEIDGFGTAYNGKINESLTEIEGEFEEGPGGRPEPLRFKRSNAPDAPEPPKTYTFAVGEAQDMRGYWRGEMDAGPMGKLTAGLNIGRLPDGTYRATLDLPEQGAKDIPATVATFTAPDALLEWKAFGGVFKAKLSEDGKILAGNWVQQGRTNSVRYTRLDGPLQLLPNNLVYTPDPAIPGDVRGTWKGVLVTPGGKLRLLLRIGRAPDGTFGGTLSSVDQGGREMPASTAQFSDSNLKMEWKGIRGQYDGKISPDGKTLEGTWEQFGAPMPLKLERVP